MKAKKVIHSLVKYNLPNRSIARSSQGSSLGKGVLLQYPSHHHIQLAAVEKVAIWTWKGVCEKLKSESFTLGSLSMNMFCNSAKKNVVCRQILPAKRCNSSLLSRLVCVLLLLTD